MCTFKWCLLEGWCTGFENYVNELTKCPKFASQFLCFPLHLPGNFIHCSFEKDNWQP